ncbi:filamin and nhl repeat containing protein [Dermatophagoides farinae]|uniref:Filamin and nhl repeat containing protein n=1 Tax=Dermatophagoides farinae TaxID=6954 RepID=A0A9D4SAM2_DERFA|nr:filamin and nhl repeat containing protein [Dermatophagoides farinae]
MDPLNGSDSLFNFCNYFQSQMQLDQDNNSSTDKSLNGFCSESNEYPDLTNTNQDSLLLNLNGFITAAVGNSLNHNNNNSNDQQQSSHHHHHNHNHQQPLHHANHQQQQKQPPQQFRDNILQSSAFLMANHNNNNQPQQHSYAFPSSSNSSSPPLSQTSGPSSASSETAVASANIAFNHSSNNNNKSGNANRLNFLDSQNLSSSLVSSSTTNNNNNTSSPLLSKVINNPFNNQVSRKNENLFLSTVNPLDNAFSLMVSNSLLNKNSSTNNTDATTTGQQDISSLFSRANDGIPLGSSAIDLVGGEHQPTMAINNNVTVCNVHQESLLLNSGVLSADNSGGDLILGNSSNNQSRSKISPSSFSKNNTNCMGKNLSSNSNSNVSPPIISNNNNNNNNSNCNQSLFTTNQLAILNDLLEQQQSTTLHQRLLNNNNKNNNNLNNLVVTGSNISMLARFDHQIQSLANEINSTVQLYINSIQMRKEQLLKQLDHVRNAYSLSIDQQLTANNNNDNNKSKPPITQLPKITFTRPDQNLFKSITSFGFINTPAFGPYCQISGEGLSMAIEGEPTCFSIITKNCFNEEILIGGENIDIEIQSNETTAQNNSFIPNSSFQIQKNILDNNNGKYNVTYTIPRGSGIRSAKIFISINGLLTSNSPYLITVKTERLRENWKLLTVYGEEGTEPGKFCRPWGIAITRLPLQKDSNHKLVGDVNAPNIPIQSKSFYQWQCPNYRKDYLLTVADRSNNRIQVLKLSVFDNINNNTNSTGQFMMSNSSSMMMNKVEISVLHVFGNGPGTRPGLFDRPAGIAINSNLGQLIVADKDNHRIQAFDLAGGFLFKFGEKGSRPGQFCYPWDVAICPQTSMILVSDTRNRRIQLFTHYGQYLWHCGQPLDSPRGVAFLTPDRYIISDFNKHRLLIIDRNDSNSHPIINHRDDLITSKYIGFGEGSAWGEFLRPQGLVASVKKNSMVSKYVQILCADSRNNRIAIYNSLNQNFDYINGESSTANGIAFDRPSGIAIADNILAIIDFGNNRLQIFQNNLG